MGREDDAGRSIDKQGKVKNILFDLLISMERKVSFGSKIKSHCIFKHNSIVFRCELPMLLFLREYEEALFYRPFLVSLSSWGGKEKHGLSRSPAQKDPNENEKNSLK